MDDTSKKHGRCRLLDECGLRATPPDGMENEEEEREKEKKEKIIGWKKIERTVFWLLLFFSFFFGRVFVWAGKVKRWGGGGG